MTVELLDIAKLAKINMSDEFLLGCLIEHFWRENG